MLNVTCAICQWALREQGGLLFGPPVNEAVVKTHVCKDCWPLITRFIESERFGFRVD